MLKLRRAIVVDAGSAPAEAANSARATAPTPGPRVSSVWSSS